MSDDKTTELRWEVGQVWERDGHRWRVDIVHGDYAVLQSLATSWARTTGIRIEDHLRDCWTLVPPLGPLVERPPYTVSNGKPTPLPGLVDITADAQRACIETLRKQLVTAEKDRDAAHNLSRTLNDNWRDAMRACTEAQLRLDDMTYNHGCMVAERDDARASLAHLKDALVAESRAKVVALDEAEKLRAHIRAINQRLDLPPDAGVKEAMRVIFEKMEHDKESIRGSERYALRDAEERDRLRAEVERLNGVLKQAQSMGPAVAAEAIGQHAKRQGLEAENERLRAEVVQRTDERDAANELCRLAERARDNALRVDTTGVHVDEHNRVCGEREHLRAQSVQRTSERDSLRDQLAGVKLDVERYKILLANASRETQESKAKSISQLAEAALQQQLEAINERIGIPRNSTWNDQLNAVIQLHEKYEDLTSQIRTTVDRLNLSRKASDLPADMINSILAFVDELTGRIDELLRERNEAMDVRDRALMTNTTGGLEAILLGMLGLRRGDDIVKHVEGMADQIAELLRQREVWSVAVKNAIGLREAQQALDAQREEYDEANREVDRLTAALEMATRDRAAWAASNDNAINLQRDLYAVAKHRDDLLVMLENERLRAEARAERDEARARSADDLSGALGAAHSREMTQRHRAETAEHERDALTRQMALRRELQAETDDAVRKCKQLGEACACVAQEEAHKWELRITASERDGMLTNVDWARGHAKVARDIEEKIRALLEAKP